MKSNLEVLSITYSRASWPLIASTTLTPHLSRLSLMTINWRSQSFASRHLNSVTYSSGFSGSLHYFDSSFDSSLIQLLLNLTSGCNTSPIENDGCSLDDFQSFREFFPKLNMPRDGFLNSLLEFTVHGILSYDKDDFSMLSFDSNFSISGS